jgi:D-glycero-D-manno-heptose 1,7-bisphosphate phosphatase
VFLDRDGTINEEVGLIEESSKLRLIPGAALAMARLKAAGAVLIVTTNQPVVARGLVDETGLDGIHARLKEMLAQEGAVLDAVFYCPHHPETHHAEAADPRYRKRCDCRKPEPGMLLRGAERFGLDPAACYMVGDSTRDVAAGRAAGCRAALLLETGFAGGDGTCPDAKPDAVLADLAAAAEWILDREARG